MSLLRDIHWQTHTDRDTETLFHMHTKIHTQMHTHTQRFWHHDKLIYFAHSVLYFSSTLYVIMTPISFHLRLSSDPFFFSPFFYSFFCRVLFLGPDNFHINFIFNFVNFTDNISDLFEYRNSLRSYQIICTYRIINENNEKNNEWIIE